MGSALGWGDSECRHQPLSGHGGVTGPGCSLIQPQCMEPRSVPSCVLWTRGRSVTLQGPCPRGAWLAAGTAGDKETEKFGARDGGRARLLCVSLPKKQMLKGGGQPAQRGPYFGGRAQDVGSWRSGGRLVVGRGNSKWPSPGLRAPWTCFWLSGLRAVQLEQGDRGQSRAEHRP